MHIRSDYSIERETQMKKTIITVVGNDTVGIIAKVCTYLACLLYTSDAADDESIV